MMFQRFLWAFHFVGLTICCGPISWAQSIPLDRWELSIDKGKTFHPVVVPATVENSLDINFDGQSIYRTKLSVPKFDKNQHLVIRFGAVATQARVFINETLVAEHLGGWTPFTADISDAVRKADPAQDVWLRVEVDEKVGHNTQGFLSVVTNHFSGLWQPVTLHVYSSAYIWRDGFCAHCGKKNAELLIKVPLVGDVSLAEFIRLPNGNHRFEGRFEIAEFNDGEINSAKNVKWTRIDHLRISTAQNSDVERLALAHNRQEIVFLDAACDLADLHLKPWTPQSPQLYRLRYRLFENEQLLDAAETVFGVRDFEAQGDQFKLNGQPISIRGVLNWGYSPPSLAPTLDRESMREEIQFAKNRGFNLMKFCLYVPPKEYLELCDQMGMLAWIEYPTWHPKLDGQHLEELRREYAEFFNYDRRHPSVVLRSLTCETGSSAERSVIQSLYDQCKAFIPNAVVEDDSSWISWNRVHDFYDDHPYGNNQTWRKTLGDLRNYMQSRTQKPLALGEAIAADTWLAPTEAAIEKAKTDVAHGSWSIADNQRWIDQISLLTERRQREFHPELMYEQSVHYGMLMRKFQIEVFHAEMPTSGYVVSVLRDFPKASMGLIDANNNYKTGSEEWSFQGDNLILLQTQQDRRSFWSGTTEAIELIAKQLPVSEWDSTITIELCNAQDAVVWNQTHTIKTVDVLTRIPVELKLPQVDKPTRFTITTFWPTGTNEIELNEWPIWVFPQTRIDTNQIEIHSSAKKLAEELKFLPIVDSRSSGSVGESSTESTKLILARQLDNNLLQKLENGARLIIIPDGQSGSFPIQSHWFLRGSVVATPKKHDAWHQPFSTSIKGAITDQNMFVELQHFDLAGPVIPNLTHYLDKIDPLVLLWDNHDMRETRTHGLAFQCRVGKGLMLVSTLNHLGETNSVGRWLFDQWSRSLLEPLSEPTEADYQLARTLQQELNRKQLSLASNDWNFQVDPTVRGKELGWFKPDFDDTTWGKIRIDRHWEGQGHSALDGWAWYRTRVEVPADWVNSKLYLNISGIDDYADIFVGGKKIASVGDIANKQTAFEVRASYEISQQVSAAQTLDIAIAVYDWFGAGGIFRPITLSTEPISSSPPILSQKAN